MSKRILSMVLAMVLMCSNVFAAPISTVTDIPTWWSQKAVEKAIEEDILTANNGLIRPMDLLTRAEMAQGINNAFGATKKADIASYTDVPQDKWYYEDMQKAVAMGTISGYGNGLLKPDKNITREEMFTVIYNALNLESGNLNYLEKFNDKALVSDWAKGITARMIENNYVAGNAMGNIKPIDNITREEFAQVMKNIFAEYYGTAGTYTDVPAGNIVINTKDVELKDTTVTGDLIIADGVGEGEVTLNNVNVIGRTLVRGGGENSIKLKNNTTLNGQVIVNNNIGKVRIYNSKSKVKNVEVKTPVILEGDFDNVKVSKATQVETKGNINKIEVNEKAEITVTTGKIEEIDVKDTAVATTVSGKGKVTKVNANANDVVVSTSKTEVIAGATATGVKAGKTEVKPGKTSTVSSSSGGGGGGGSSSGGGGSSSNKVTIPTLKLTDIENGGKIDLGTNYSKFDVSYVYNNGRQTAWYKPATRYLTPNDAKGEEGWNSDVNIVKVKYGTSEKELRIRPSTPSFEVDKLNGKVIMPNFEQVKEKYEYSIEKWYDENSYLNFTSENELSIGDELYIREKATNILLASCAQKIEIIRGTVSEISEVKYDNNGKPYRELKINNIPFSRYISYENAEDKYLSKLGEGKSLLSKDFEIKVGDSISIYNVEDTIKLEGDDFEPFKEDWAINIKDIVLYFGDSIEDFVTGKITAYDDSTRTIEIDGEEYVLAEDVKVTGKYGFRTSIEAVLENMGITNPSENITRNINVEAKLNEDLEVCELELVFSTELTNNAEATMHEYVVTNISEEKITHTKGELDLAELKETFGEAIQVTKDGEEATLEDIEEGDIITIVYYAATVVYMDISSETVEDVLNSYDEETNTMEIGNEEYKVVSKPYYKVGEGYIQESDVSKIATTFSGMEVTVGLNYVGEIVTIVPSKEYYEEALDELINLGIMDYDAYGNFDAEGNVSKNEMAQYVARIIGINSNEMDLIHEILWQKEIIPIDLNDNSFGGEENITEAEAITMIVRALGWGAVVEQTGTWPSNYINKASELRLFKNAVGTGEYVLRGDAAIYVHNALDAETWSAKELEDGTIVRDEDSATLREKYFNYNIPTFAPGDTWYKGETDKKTLDKIVFTNTGKREITESEIEYWNADIENKGDIFCYIVDDVLYIDGNGNEQNKIYANEDASFMFAGFDRMFRMGITNIDILDTSKTTNMSGMFYGCGFLGELDVSNFDTNRVTDMSYMFYDCGFLDELDVSNFVTSQVVNMNSMFSGCGVSELDISNFDTSKTTNMKEMFYNCSNLRKLNISNLDTSQVTDMSMMFSDSQKLGKLDISSFDTNKVAEMTGIFANMKCLAEIKLGKTFTFIGKGHGLSVPDSVYIDGADGNWYDENGVVHTINEIVAAHSVENTTEATYYAVNPKANINFVPTFAPGDTWYKGETDKKTLTKIVFSNTGNRTLIDENIDHWNADVESKGDIFCYIVDNVLYIDGNGQNKVYTNIDASSMFSGFGNYKTGIQTIANIDILDTSKTTNMKHMFYMSHIKELDVSNFDTSNVIDMSDMFGGNDIQELDVSNFDTSNVTDMNYMFAGCEMLKEINVSNFNTSRVINMEGMFSACYELEKLDVSNFDTSNVTNMANMFEGCEMLKEIDVSNFDTSNVEEMISMFEGCEMLKEIDVSNFDTSNVEYMHGMFRDCILLEKLDVSNFDTSKIIGMDGMFEGCEMLKEIDVSNFDTSNVYFMSEMFEDCSMLEKLDLSNFNTSKVEDDEDIEESENMFKGMNHLSEIKLGKNFTFVGDNCLPEPNAYYIDGADGYWYDENGVAHTVEEIVEAHSGKDNVEATYYAVKLEASTTTMIYKTEEPSVGDSSLDVSSEEPAEEPSVGDGAYDVPTEEVAEEPKEEVR